MLDRVGPLSLASVVASVLLVGALAACGGGEPASTNGVGGGPVEVVASTALLAEFARAVGGDDVTVETLIPAGVDAHSFEPRPGAAATVSEADLVLVNGYRLEEGLLDIIVTNLRTGTPLVATAAGIEALSDAHEDGDAPPASPVASGFAPIESSLAFAEGDPHAWLAVPNAVRYVENVRDALAAVDPAHTASYGERADRTIEELRALDEELRASMLAVPPERRQIVVFHDAFAYFGREYGFEVVAALTANPNRQPSARDLAAVIEVVRSLEIGTVFAESQFPSLLIDAVASETGARVLTLHSQPGAGIEDYAALMRANAEALVEGLSD